MSIRSMALSAAFLLSAAVSVSRIQAAELILTYDGATSTSSSLNGIPISAGTSYEISAVFDDIPIASPVPGLSIYQPVEITARFGGMSYSELTPSNFTIRFLSPTNPGLSGLYVAALDGNGPAFAPVYTMATPPLDATAATPTAFSGYDGYYGNVLNLTTTSGILGLDFDTKVGVSASINSIPEPGSLILTGIGLLAGLGLGIWGRRCPD